MKIHVSTIQAVKRGIYTHEITLLWDAKDELPSWDEQMVVMPIDVFDELRGRVVIADGSREPGGRTG